MSSRGGAPLLIASRFQLGDELGVGGAGAVYRAFDRARGRHVALKVLRDGGASSASSSRYARSLLRFRREFRLASRMRHPNCVRAHVFGECAMGPFFVMDLADGGRLRDVIADGPHPLGAALAMAAQLLRALDYIHSRRIVHRDLKPDNVLLSERPRPERPASLLLNDFGIAKVGDLADEMNLGRVECTPAYAAPEVLTGEPSDPRVDLYAFGIIVYQLLTGHHPLIQEKRRFSSSEWVRIQLEAQPLDVRELAPGTPPPISELLMQLLAKAPEERPRTAAIAYDVLRRWLPPETSGSAPLEGSPYLAAPRLVGREAELAAACGFMTRALAERAASPAGASEPPSALALMISGEPGAGKSRLLDQIVRAAPPGTVVVAGRCRSEPGSADDAAAQILATLADAHAAVSRVRREADTTVTLGLPAGRAREATFDDIRKVAAAQLLDLGATLGCLVVVEDAQWIDAESIRLLVYLMRATLTAHGEGRPARVAFVWSHRHAQPDNQVSPLYEALERIGAPFMSVPLTPLSSGHVLKLVGSMLMTPPDEAVEAFCRPLFSRRATPLYVTQVLELLLLQGRLTRHTFDARGRWRGVWNLGSDGEGERLPETVIQAIDERAARLSVQTQEALTAASVIGRRFTLHLLRRSLDVNGNHLLTLLEEAAEAGFLVREADEAARRDAYAARDGVLESAEDEDGGAALIDARFAFVHDRHREALYELQGAASRRQAHARIAETIAAMHGADPAWAAELCTHYAGCDDHARAYRHGLEAARYAAAQGAPYRAVGLLEDALLAASQAGIAVPSVEREVYADLCVSTGRFDIAKASYRVCLDGEVGPERRLELLRKAGECDMRAGEYRDAARPLEQLLGLLGYSIPSSPLGRAIRLPVFLAVILLIGLFPRLRRARPRAAPELSRMSFAARVLQVLGENYMYVDNYRAFYVAARGGALAASMGPGPMTASALASIGYVMSSATGLHAIGRRYREAALSHIDEQAAADQAVAYAACIGIGIVGGERDATAALLPAALRAAVEARDVSRTSLALIFVQSALRYSGRMRSALAVARALRRLGERSAHDQMMSYASLFADFGEVVLRAHRFTPSVYEDGLASASRRDDALAKLAVKAHFALAAALHGQVERVSYEELLDVGEAFLAGRFVSAANHTLSCVLAATALAAPSRPPTRAEWGQLGRFARRARVPCMNQSHERILYLGACGAILYIAGRRREAQRLLAQAQKDARSRGMLLHEALVHRIFARVAPEGSSDREHHLERYEELERSLAEDPLDAELDSLLRRV